MVLFIYSWVIAKTVSTSSDVSLLRCRTILSIQLGASARLRAVLTIGGVVISYLLKVIIHVIWSHGIRNHSRYIKNTLCTSFKLCLSVILKLCLILPRIKTLIISKLSMATFSWILKWILLLLALGIILLGKLTFVDEVVSVAVDLIRESKWS